MKTLLQYSLVLTAFILTPWSSSQGFVNPFTKPEAPEWSKKLEQKVKSIDAASNGNLGVYIKKMGATEEMSYQADRNWYFASTVKVPVAIAILQLVEEGKLQLDQKVVLKKSDPVDGSGEVQFKPPGSQLSISYLLEKMLTQSDSTATDLLIGLIGVDELNKRIEVKMGVSGFRPFTTILQVRHDAFSKLHPNAKNLTNQDFIDLKKHRSSSAKYKIIAKKMNVPVSELKEKSIEDAFERYYQSGLNSGTLRSFGLLLERLAAGQLLSKPNTDLIYRHMSAMTTGENRIKAGLPKGVRFAQKTGTQVRRICNVGVLTMPAPKKENYVVTACLEKFGNFAEAEGTLKKVGKAMASVMK